MEEVYSKYVVPEYNLLDIVCHMSEDDWTLAYAQYWADKLTARGFVITNVYEFYADVKVEFAPFYARLFESAGKG